MGMWALRIEWGSLVESGWLPCYLTINFRTNDSPNQPAPKA